MTESIISVYGNPGEPEEPEDFHEFTCPPASSTFGERLRYAVHMFCGSYAAATRLINSRLKGADYSETYLSTLAARKRTPKQSTILKFAIGFHIDPEFFTTDDDEKIYNSVKETLGWMEEQDELELSSSSGYDSMTDKQILDLLLRLKGTEEVLIGVLRARAITRTSLDAS